MILGKIFGAIIGFRIALVPGLLIGLIIGHMFDRWLAKSGLINTEALNRSLNPWARKQQLFTDCVIALSAKLAKADGPVNRAEVDAFKTEFRIAQAQLKAVGVLYDRAKRTPEGFEPYAQRLAATFADAPMLLAGVIDALRRIALSDGPIQPAESEFLAKVAAAFRLTGRAAASAGGEDDPYTVLGVSRTASMEEIKLAWRELVRQHHPDTLMAKGLPKDYVELATRKMAAINAAYDSIRAQRGEN